MASTLMLQKMMPGSVGVLKCSRLTSGLQTMRFFGGTAPLNRVENVIILGSGLMGSGIAQSCATTGKFNSIVLQDVNQKALDSAQKRITQSLAKLSEKKKISIDKSPEEVAARITLSTEVKPVSEQNLLIIEAVPEVIELKQNIFKSLSEQFKTNSSVILATNTSSLPCREINQYVVAKERFAALHFFNPVPLMKLVEVARTPETTDEVFEALLQFVKDIDHVGVACKDNQGFIVNRLLSPYMHEALRLMEDGIASARDIDTAMKLGAGYPMGPFELLDYVGLDTHSHVADSFVRGDPTFQLYRSKTLDELVAKGHLGRKTGRGFYDYSGEEQQQQQAKKGKK